jgi:energy-coupling factor transporter transmembrane protein EcfT
MDIGAIDRVAVSGASPLHRASPLPKLAAFALIVTSVVLSRDPLVVGALIAFLLAVAVGCRLPLGTVLSLAAYPAVLAALFAVALAPGLLGALVIVGKAAASGLAAIILVLTTPYPFIFAPLQRFLPTLVGDTLLMTYRSFFLLLERFEHTFRAARLRAGSPAAAPMRAAGSFATSLGSVALYSIDLSQRTYDVMHLRGYDGRLRVTPPAAERPLTDVAVVALAALVAAASVAWRVAPVQLSPFAWVLVSVASAALAVAGATRIARRRR